jgi:sacsin
MPIEPECNNAQRQPLTTLLRNIIREYPAGGGVLRELCQNADDAGATAIEFVLDRSHYPTDALLHEDLAEYQGPSLLAYNNRIFTETDFESLSRIGDSAKVEDLSTTGKFGRGFNSVSAMVFFDVSGKQSLSLDTIGV